MHRSRLAFSLILALVLALPMASTGHCLVQEGTGRICLRVDAALVVTPIP